MLFGHQSDDAKPTGIITAPTDDVIMPGVNPLAVDPDTGVSLPTAPPPPPPVDPTDTEEPSVLNQPMGNTAVTPDPTPEATELPTPPTITDITPGTNAGVPAYSSTPLPPPMPAPQPNDDGSNNDDDSDSGDDATADDSTDTNTDNSSAAPATDDLLALKQQALTELSPLVDQLDQTPEERFRTTMMLIQSTDDPGRIPEAYKAAQAITDEKVRAQALLDVINEINYFTQGRQHTTDQTETAI